MTLQEFKAWFDGFTEGMDSTPNQKQWDRIKARVKEINGIGITERVFIDRYWTYPHIGSPVPPTVYPWWYTTCTGGSSYNIQGNVNILDDGHKVFNSSIAMHALGQVEANQS